MNIQRKYNRNTGFTLVELLVVVAIIGILTSIAAVNFQSAAARCKTVRVQSDMHTLAGALERYRTDFGYYPSAALGDYQLERPLDALTTPIGYMSSIPADPFGEAVFDFNDALSMTGYNYKDKRTTSSGMPGETYGYIWRDAPRREYLLHSCGPNRVWDVHPYVEYDPTNGTISAGDICRIGP